MWKCRGLRGRRTIRKEKQKGSAPQLLTYRNNCPMHHSSGYWTEGWQSRGNGSYKYNPHTVVDSGWPID